MNRRRARPSALLAAAILLLVAAGCTRIQRTDEAERVPDQGPAAELRLGYFPNVTHAAALIGTGKGLFANRLGKTRLTPVQFNAGPDEVGALLGGSLDAGFIGSGPAINAFSKSEGSAVRMIAGATSRGAQLVVRPEIRTPDQLRGKTIATPQVGNTQDVAAKKWLATKGLTGKVNITSMQNSQTLNAFRSGEVQAAWLPEPWSSRLVLDAGAKVLLDESSLWPGGQFPTTVLVVRTEFLHAHPETVRALLRGELDAIGYAERDPAGAKAEVNAQLKKLTGKSLSGKVIDRAWTDITVSADPLCSRFPALARDQQTAGITARSPEVSGMADLRALNEVRAQAHQSTISSAGLDKK
ncbi:ABC transporter substrate-binding protein [Sciscionella sediminilitoris]|uniref:ABC transporter substrate-binding protein n=1 Tax=Sciscionella sediminilitoris TaxID=1445613 RepID=UPI0004DF8CF8|nr:ABC transporter substrate-binding protein [Sciscionella sp. SE31]